VHGVSKVSARRAPEIGEHNEQILEQLGFDPKAIEGFRATGAVAEVRGAEAAR
jgi:formyl-CoA transferase